MLLSRRRLGFVSLSIGVHIGLLWLADASLGRTVLTTPAAMTVVGVWALQTAWDGPLVLERTGSYPRAFWTGICVSWAVVAIGIVAAHMIEGATITPAMKSALITPWWFVFTAVTLWAVVRNRAEGAQTSERPDRIVLLALVGLLIPLSAAAAIVVFSIQLSYYGS